MKRLGITGLLLAAACSVATSASAQAVAKGKNEVYADLFFITAKSTGDVDEDRSTSAEVTLAYARLLTDRFAAGPLFRIAKSSGNDTLGYVGGQARYYFGDLSNRAIPFVEINSTRSYNEPVADYNDLQLRAGVMIPLGPTGGRLRISPYYYRAFYNEALTGYSSYQSFGISWGVGLLF